MTIMILTDDNYYSQEANEHYMSVSQFKQGVDCVAQMVAELKGEYKRPYSTALTVGSYIHAAFESVEVFEKFRMNNEKIIVNTKGKKYADFIQADKMINALMNDELAMYALTGDKEVIYTGELFGIQWKIKIDNINHEKGFFSDIKSTQELRKRYWSDRHKRYVSFVEMYGYDIQMAVYQEIIRQNTGHVYAPYIVAVTKENVPDKAIIGLDDETLQGALEYVRDNVDIIVQAKYMDDLPAKFEIKRCERCEYCRSTKKLSNVITMEDLLK